MRYLKWAAISLTLLILLAAGGLVWLDANMASLVESAVKTATGRTLTISRVDITWSLHLLIRLEDVTFENAPWSEQETMAHAKALKVRVDWVEWLKGSIVLPELELVEPKLVLEKNAQGEANWRWGKQEDKGPPTLPAIGRFKISEGVLNYHEAASARGFVVEVTSLEGGPQPTGEGMTYTGEGRFVDKPFTVNLTAGPFATLTQGTAPYPIDLVLSLGETRLHTQGILEQPLKLAGINLSLTLEGPDPAQALSGLPFLVPHLPSYKVKGALARQGDIWSFNDFLVTVGNSDVAGTLHLKAAERMRLEGHIHSQKLDINDVGPGLGLPPGASSSEAASKLQQGKARKQEKSTRVIPDQKLPLEALHKLDLKLQFKGQQVIVPHLPLNDVHADIALEQGMLTLQPLDVGVADGRLKMNLTVNAQAKTPSAELQAEFKTIRLQALLKAFGKNLKGVGVLNGHARLTGDGASVAKVLDTLDGELTLGMQGGTFDKILDEILEIDAAETIAAALSQEDTVPIRCMLAEFEVDDGMMRIDTMVFDTIHTLATAEGYIDLGAERVEIKLIPRDKEFSALSAESPIYLQGPFKKLTASPKLGEALRALLTPVKTGTDEEADCQALAERARKQGREAYKAPVIKK